MSQPAPTAKARKARDEVEEQISQYPAPVQAQLRAQLEQQTAAGRLRAETQPMESFRPKAEEPEAAQQAKAELEKTAAQISDLRQEAGQPIPLSIPMEGAQTSASELLATFKEIAATMRQIASTGLPAGTGAVPPTTPPTPAPRNPAAAVTKTPKPEVAATPEQKPAVAAATPTVREEPVQPTEQAQVVQPARRQQFVEAIASVQRGESPIDPDTGQPLTAISQEHALRSLRQRMNALGHATPPPVAATPPRARVTATPTRAPAPPATAAELTAAPGFVQPGPAQVGVSYSSGEFSADEEKERLREARSVRQQEVAAQAATRRQEREDRAQEKAQLRAVSRLPAPRPPSILDESNQQAQAQGPQSATIYGPGYRSNEDQERERATGGPTYQRTPEQQAGIDRARQQASQLPPQAVSTGGGGGGGPRDPRETARAERVIAQAYEREDVASRRRNVSEEIRFRRAETNREIQQAAIARQRDIAIARQEADILTAGRTARTASSTAGGLLIGPGQKRIELEQNLAAATRDYNSAQRYRLTFDNAIAAKEGEAAVVGGRRAQILQREADAIRQRPDRTKAIEDETAALTKQEKAQGALVKFEKSPLNLARNLAAVTLAGAAFGAGLQAINVAASALAPALGDAIDQVAGFGATSNKVTQNLAQQTTAAHGNVEAVLALADAQAGLSANSSEAIDNQIRLTTQVKTGAQAAAQAGGLVRAGIGANQQAPQGLLGGFGGVLGGPLLAQQLGGGTGFAETVGSTFQDFQRGSLAAGGGSVAGLPQPIVRNPISDFFGNILGANKPVGGNNQPQGPTQEQLDKIAALTQERTDYETSLNDAAKRGAAALGLTGDAVVHFGKIVDTQTKTAAQQQADFAASSLPAEFKKIAASGEALYDSNGKLITSYDAVIKGLEQPAVGQGITPPEQLGRANLAQELQREKESAANLPAIQAQQAFTLPSQINAIGRQAGYATQFQQPAQAALANLANPLQPPTTGIAPSDQGRVSAGIKLAQSDQVKLNAYYQQGQDIIENTYKPAVLQQFGQALYQDFSSALSVIKQTGQQIASIQAGLSNEQAAYQVAQYNFQLFIAKRTLSDIGGLTDHNFGAGESYLGTLERQNLLLGRQGQQLQFNLSQRQINFQTALAGFQAPGVTPEERQARIAEAKTEAGYSQKQLDIQRQMFGNQVKIVDIGNLRQGADLAKQISLLVQGRQVTLDTKVAEARLLRLQQLQQVAVQKAGTYLTAVDNATALASSRIQQLEEAYGHAIVNITNLTVKQFNKYLQNMVLTLGGFGPLNTVQGTQDQREGPSGVHGASGLLGMTGGTTRLTVGEAGGEAVAILRNPKAMDGGGLGGGVTNNFYISGNSVRNDNDLDVLVRKVTQALGKEASLKGLRGIG